MVPDQVDQEAEKLAKEVAVANGEVPRLEVLTPVALRNHITALLDQPGSIGYRRLMAAYATRMQLNRLLARLRPNWADPDMQARIREEGVMQTFYQYIPNAVVHHLREMQEYMRVRDALGIPVNADLQRQAILHINDLTAVVGLRSQLGQYGQLITLRGEMRTLHGADSPVVQNLNKVIAGLKKNVAARLATATAHTPNSSVRIRTPGRTTMPRLPAGTRTVGATIEVPVSSFINADTDATHFGALGVTNGLLDLEISWLMSGAPGVPGFAQPPENVIVEGGRNLGILPQRETPPLPSEGLTMELLERALRLNVEEARKVVAAATEANRKPTEARLKQLADQRQFIIRETIRLIDRMGRNRIANIELLSARDALVRIGAPDGSAPLPSASNAEMTKYLEQELKQQMEGVRKHMQAVIEDGNPLRDVPEVVEDFFNGPGRQAALRIMEGVLVVRGAPRAAVRAIPGIDIVGDIPVVGEVLNLEAPAKVRERQMREIRVAMGYPENYDPLLSEEENRKTNGVTLTDADRKRIAERLRSTLTVLREHRPIIREQARLMNEDLDAIVALRTAAPADALLGIEPATEAQLRPHLVGGRVTPATIKAIAALPNGPAKQALFMAAYITLFSQMEGDWSQYIVKLGNYLQALEGILGQHLQLGAALNRAADNLWPTWLKILSAIGGTAFLWWLGGRGGIARFPIANTTLRWGRIPMGGSWGAWLPRGVLRIFNAPFSAADRLIFGAVNLARGRPGQAWWSLAAPGGRMTTEVVISPALTTANILTNLNPTLIRFRSLQMQIAALQAERGLVTTTAVRRAAITAQLEILYAQRSALQADIMRTLNGAEGVLPEAEAAALRGAAAERLLSRSLTSAQVAIVAEMHIRGEAGFATACGTACRRVMGSGMQLSEEALSALRRADMTRESVAEALRRAGVTGLSNAELDAILAAKRLRIAEKVRFLQAEFRAGRWVTTNLAADIEMLCHSGVTGRGGLNAGAGAGELAGGANWGQRTLAALGIAVQVAVTVLDVMEAQESAKICTENEAALRKSLMAWSREDPRFVCTNERQGRFEFRESTAPRARVLFTVSIADFSAHARAQAANARVAADVAGLAVTGLLLAGRISNPVGWALIGLEVVVRVGIDAWEYSTYYDVVRRCPKAVLVRLGGTPVITGGRDEHDLLSGRLSRIFVTPERSLRETLMFSFAMRHIAINHPALYRQITLGLNTPGDIDALYEDFRTNIIPYFISIGYVTAEHANIPWDNWRDLRCDEALVFTPVTQRDLMRAFDHTAEYWAGHREEGRRITWRREVAQIRTQLAGALPAERRTALQERLELLERALFQQGFTVVFGRPLRDVDADIDRNNPDIAAAPRTRHSMLGRLYYDRLNTTPGNTWQTKLMSSYSSRAPHWLTPFADNGSVSERSTDRVLVFETSELPSIRSRNRNFVVANTTIHGLPGRVPIRAVPGEGSDWHTALPGRIPNRSTGPEYRGLEHRFDVLPYATAVIPRRPLADPANAPLRNRQSILDTEVALLDTRVEGIIKARNAIAKELLAESRRETPDFAQFEGRLRQINVDIALYFYDLQQWETEGIAIVAELTRLAAATDAAFTRVRAETTDHLYNNDTVRTELTQRLPELPWLRRGTVMASGGIDMARDGVAIEMILRSAADLQDVAGMHIRRAPAAGNPPGRFVFHVVFVCGRDLDNQRPDRTRIRMVQQGFIFNPANNTLEPGLRITRTLPRTPLEANPDNLRDSDFSSYVQVNFEANFRRGNEDYTKSLEDFNRLNPRQRLDRAMASTYQLRELYRDRNNAPVYGVRLPDGRLMVLRTTVNRAILWQIVPLHTLTLWRAQPADTFQFNFADNSWRHADESFCRRLAVRLNPASGEEARKQNQLSTDENHLAACITMPNDFVSHDDLYSAVNRILYLTRYGDHTHRYLSRTLDLFYRSIRDDNLPPEFRDQINAYNRAIGRDPVTLGDPRGRQAFLAAFLNRAMSFQDRDLASTANCEILLKSLRDAAGRGAFGDADQRNAIPDTYNERDPRPRRWNPDDMRRPASFIMSGERVTVTELATIDRLNSRSDYQLRQINLTSGPVMCIEVLGVDPSMIDIVRTSALARCRAANLPGHPTAADPEVDHWFDPVRHQWIFQIHLQMPAQAQMTAWLGRYRSAFFTGAVGEEVSRRAPETMENFRMRALLSFARSMGRGDLFAEIFTMEDLRTHLGRTPAAATQAIIQRLREAPTTGLHCNAAGDLRIGNEVVAANFAALLESDPWAAMAAAVLTQNHAVQTDHGLSRLRRALTVLHDLSAPEGVVMPPWNNTVTFLGERTHVIGRPGPDDTRLWDTEPLREGGPRLAATPQSFVYTGERCEFELPSAYHVQRIFTRDGRQVTENDYHGAQSLPWDQGTGQARVWREIPGEVVAEGGVPNRPPDAILNITCNQAAEAVAAWPAQAAEGAEPTTREIRFRGPSVTVRLPGPYYVRRTVFGENDATTVAGSYGHGGRVFEWSETAERGYADIWLLPPNGIVPTAPPRMRLNFTRE